MSFTIQTGHAATNGIIPVGGIIMWSGTIATIPANWALCDGTNSTPDLRDKFIVGAKQDDAGAAKSNIRGSLEVSHTVTGFTLSHNGSVADHTGLTHSGVSVADHPSISALGGMSVGAHPDLTHNAITIADHPSTSMTIGAADHAKTVHSSVRTSAGASITAIVSLATAHALTGPTFAAISHTITGVTVTHAGTAYGTHAVTGPSAAALAHTVTQPAAHGTAGTVTHSFTPPSDHTGSIVPAFYSLAFIMRVS